MENRNDPGDVVLSPHERLRLRHIEAQLRADRRLTRRMWHRGSRVWLPLSAAVPACASLVLIVLGIRTSDPAVIWSFAAV